MASKFSLPFGKKDAAPVVPSKTTLNLAIREVNEADRKSNIVIAVVAILALLLLGKFGFLDVFAARQEAEDKKNAALNEKADTQLMLARYQSFNNKYSHYFNAFLSDEELALLDRIQLLDMLNDELFSKSAHMVSINVKQNEVITQFSGVTLKQAGILQANMLSNPMVEDAYFSIAQTDKKDAGEGENKEVLITMTVLVQQPTESEVSGS